MHRCALVLALLTSACVSIPRPPIVTPPPAAAAYATVACVIQDEDGQPVSNATCRVTDASAATFSGITNADGYVALDGVHTGKVHVEALAIGYKPYTSEPDDYAIAGNVDAHITLALAHVDPRSIALSQLLAFRGSLFTVVADCQLPMFLPSGQRVPVVPFAPLWATPEQRQCTYDAWKARGYVQAVLGPGLDPGYHSQTPSYDMRTDGGADYMNRLEEAFDKGFVPIPVAVPDHRGPEFNWDEHIWTIDELKALEPIYRSPRFQRLARVVMLCWECQGSQYGWRNETYVAYLSWLKDVFPDAIRILHTVADIEAPVGDGDETNTANCHGLPPSRCLTNGQAWANITPLFHVWFHQSSALFTPEHLADNGKTDGENWLLLWDRENPYSFVNRFGRGVAGWPTTSANGGPLIALPAEYRSYPTWWRNEPESIAREWGDLAIHVGAPGYMDGGTVAVPPVTVP